MQNSQSNLRLARLSPRRARRGALMPAALLAVLVITVLLSQFAGAQLRQASAARNEARAGQLAAIAADFDYYVHDNRVDLNNSLTETGLSDRILSEREQNSFEGRYLRAGVADQIPGFDLEYLISRGADGDDVLGALRLSTSDERGRANICAILARLAQHRTGGGGPAKTGPAGPCDTSLPQHLIRTAPLSGINPAYVLREPRAGHPPPKLVGAGALNLGGNNLTVRALIATGGDGSMATEVAGPLRTPKLAGALTGLRETPASDSAPASGGNAGIAGTTSVSGTFTVQRSLTAGELSILAESSTGETGGEPARISGPVSVSGHLNTGTLTTSGMEADSLSTRSITLDGAANIGGLLTTDALQSPAVDVNGAFTARDVFTKEADIEHLNITGECTGC